MSESSVGLLRTIRLPRFLRGINRWIRDDLQPNMVLWDNRWYRTPKGMILRLPEELEADHPFKMALTQKQNGKQWVATFSYGYVHVPQWGYSGGGSGYFTGVNQWGVELNSRLLTSTPKPELVLGAEDQELIFDQNPVEEGPAGPPHPVPSGPPPPTSNTGGVDPIQPPEPI